MKTTIDIPDVVYRKVKAKSALEGRPVLDVAIMLFSAWVDRSALPAATPVAGASKSDVQSRPAWFAALRKYVCNADGRHDMDSIRASIARGRFGAARQS